MTLKLFWKSLFLGFEKLWKMLFNFLFLEIRNHEKNYYYWRNLIFGFWKIWKRYLKIIKVFFRSKVVFEKGCEKYL
jgi:hypothetical protein